MVNFPFYYYLYSNNRDLYKHTYTRMGLMGLGGTALARARVCLIVIPSFLLFGYNQSNIGGTLNYPSFIRHFPAIDTSTTTGSVKATNAKVQGTVVAIYNIGCLIGALAVTQIGNKIGRRKSLMIAAAIAAIGQIIQSSSFSLGQLIVGRVVSGIGNGGVNAVVPVWQRLSLLVSSFPPALLRLDGSMSASRL